MATLRSAIAARTVRTERTMKMVRVGREPTLTGSVVITELDDTGPVALSIGYPTATYTVTFGTVVPTGEAAAGALEPSATGKTRVGFTVTLADAPGAGASVSVPWTVTP